MWFAECRYAECGLLNVVTLNVVMLNVVMLSVVMLSVVAPCVTYTGLFAKYSPIQPDVNYMISHLYRDITNMNLGQYSKHLFSFNFRIGPMSYYVTFR